MNVKEFLEKVNPVIAGNEKDCTLLTDGRSANVFYTYVNEKAVVFCEKSLYKQRPQDMIMLLNRYDKMNEPFGEYEIWYENKDGQDVAVKNVEIV